MTKKLVKQDIGFLEYPLWFQDCQVAEQTDEGFLWKDLDGFTYRAGYKPPVRQDLLVLLYILLRSQQDGWKEELELSRFEILKACGIATGKREYERLADSLKRWKMVGVEFQGTFYDGKAYKFMNFGIIDDWEIEELTQKLHISISTRWLERIRYSNYFKMLDFEEIKKLRTPLATRLYEILIKTFQTRNDWSCGAVKLAQKIPMAERYPAHIIPKIKAAVNRINENTDLQIKLTIRRPEWGKAVFDFEKLEPTQEEKNKASMKVQVIDVSKEDLPTFQELIELMPEKEQGKKTLRELVSRKLRKHGANYVKGNILYANKKATTNYRIFLDKALKEDWGAGYMEDLQQAQKKKEVKEAKDKAERMKKLEEERIEKEAHERLSSMSEEEHIQLEEEAKASFTVEQLQSPFFSILLKTQMMIILRQRIER